ncbi:signal recognition particle protein [Sulfobacillus sp. hq2]|uniref:Signal recognition particle protein n=1 Tax=Sulfobacillus thermotolerans TaxID=338644 RepID=A0ABN5H4I9_9FIRM|nr:signal recognition particle protein [Sulfobacillus sp. hq2]AUW94538.1 signal recognition particle protein [Sulfobacillus thermotolerans]MCY0909438.1 signal recognition particle protein [Sulfobacillus thermotolerans]POB09166.1 signal recognition particle protein [Sulfobacillus sp. hq2]
MFDNLTEKLQATFKRMRSQGRLTADDVREGLRDVRFALLEADVNFKVVKEFLSQVEEEAVGQDVLDSLTPAQGVVRIVRDHLTTLMGGQVERIKMASNPPTVIYLVGLQGSGKTTTTAKLAKMLKQQGRQPLMVAADIYRPAAVDQLQALGQQIDVPVVFSPGLSPVQLAQEGWQKSRQLAKDVVLVDTAGRLHVDETLMTELVEMHEALPAHETLLVVDAMTGQDAVRVASAFKEKLPLTGVVLTKLDGDARGGAALSIRQVTGLPIKLVGSGEKVDALEPFQPDRMASRILGMGDVLTLIEKAEQSLDKDEIEERAKRIGTKDFNFEDFQAMLGQVKKLGPLSKVMEMLPGMGALNKYKDQVDDKGVDRVEAIINSMTIQERRKPDIIDGSRRLRIAKGSGTTVQEVNRLLKQFNDMRKLMKQMKAGKKRGMPKLPLKGFPDLH